MPGRLAIRAPRPTGPRPFSTAWLESPEPPPPARRRVALPDWVPESQTLSAALVAIVSLTVGLLAVFGQTPPPGTTEPSAALAAPTVAALIEPTPVSIETPAVMEQAASDLSAPESTLEPAAAPEFAQAPALEAEAALPVVRAPGEGPLLPTYRIVTYYGHPHDANMGIVGEHAMEELAELLRAEAANYAAADPSRPVIPAFELIATVAQRVPGADGTYILDTDHQTLIDYIDYAEAEGMLVVLDIQIGRGTVAAEIEKVRDLLMRPNVHLAIDPEFAVAEGETPGEHIGSVTAEDVLYAQQVLAEISAVNGIPPKILIVHQFREDMISGKERLAPYPGVQLVIDADGYGVPELKTAVYNFLVRDEPVEFGGVKLFYRQDVPVMSAQEILALVPSPDVVIYQ
jgi:hypothetical protein